MIKRDIKIKSLVFIIYFCSASLLFVSSSLAQNFLKPTVRLEVKIKDKIVSEKETVSIKLGEKIQLQVSKRRSSGRAEDITTDKDIHYHVLTPWSLTVSPEGLLESKYPSRTDNIPANNSSNHGFLSITYGKAGGNDAGSQFVNFFVDFSGTATSLPVNEKSQPSNSTNAGDTVKKTEVKNSNAAVTKSFDFPTGAFKGNIPADILELFNNKKTRQVNADEINSHGNGVMDNFNPAVSSDEQQDLSTVDSTSENYQADFIDYDRLIKMQKIKESISSPKPPNPSLNLTPEERQLYEDALKQP